MGKCTSTLFTLVLGPPVKLKTASMIIIMMSWPMTHTLVDVIAMVICAIPNPTTLALNPLADTTQMHRLLSFASQRQQDFCEFHQNLRKKLVKLRRSDFDERSNHQMKGLDELIKNIWYIS